MESYKRINRIGVVIREEIERARLDRASGLLAETDLNISRVAHLCGYAGQSQFGRAFRRQFAMTPRQYRKRSGHSQAAMDRQTYDPYYLSRAAKM